MVAELDLEAVVPAPPQPERPKRRAMSASQRQAKALQKVLDAGGRLLPATKLGAEATAALAYLRNHAGLTQRAAIERAVIALAASHRACEPDQPALFRRPRSAP